MKFDVKVPAYLYLREGHDAQEVRNVQWSTPTLTHTFAAALRLQAFVFAATNVAIALYGTFVYTPPASLAPMFGLAMAGTIVAAILCFVVWPQDSVVVLYSRGADARWLATWQAGQRGFVTAPGTPLWRVLLWAALLTTRLVRWPLTTRDETLC